MKTTLRKGENDRRRVLSLLGTSSLLATFYSQNLIALTDNTSATTSRKTTSNNVNASSLDISVFSKHLQFLNYEDMAEAAKEIGFDDIDLTVRPNGHVLPENVKDDLPKAIEACKKFGFSNKLITTNITSLEQAHSQDVINAASRLGVQYYRLGYYRTDPNTKVSEDMKKVRLNIEALAKYNASKNISGAFQNHAGEYYIGAEIWEIYQLLQGIDPSHLGCQYDIRHASVEGAQNWPTGLNLIKQNINSIVIKDYKWTKQKKGWRLENVPIGQGMVDFTRYFTQLKRANIKVPVSMHFEYDLGGAQHGGKELKGSPQKVFNMMKQDVNKVRALWEMA